VVEHTPAAYLTGGIWFGDLHFAVNEDVLVPRSYFVELIPDRFEPWQPDPLAVRRVLELCTGSGCLAVLLAHAYPDARVEAVDLSPEALAVARRNVADHRLGDRIHLHEGDLFAPLGDEGPYDLIVANPPYEPTGHLDQLPPEFSREPRIALDGGPDGLDVVLRLLAEAPRHLAPGGLLAVEVGGLRNALEAALPHLPFQWLQTHDGATAVFVLPASALQSPARRKPARRKG
jgi:ribosomal protein L3 glutamine methyltransferase